MSVLIKIDNVDVSDYAVINKIPVYGRNNDFSQIFESITLDISFDYRAHGEIKEDSKVEIFLSSNCIYVGYVVDIQTPRFYVKKIKIDHIATKLQALKLLKSEKDVTGVFKLQDEFVYPDGTKIQLLEFLEKTFSLIGYEDFTAPNNITAGTNIFSVNLLDTTSFKYVGQDYEWVNPKIVFENDIDNSPTLWELLQLLQKVFHFKLQFGSLYAGTPTITAITPGFYFADDLTIPAGDSNADCSFEGLSSSVTVEDLDSKDNKKVDKEFKNETYSIITKGFPTLIEYSDLNTEITELTEYSKTYKDTIVDDKKVGFPDHFIFTRSGQTVPNIDFIPFALQVNFNSSTRRYQVQAGYVSAYSRWIYPNDYAQVGSVIFPPIYREFFERNSILYAEEESLLQTAIYSNILDKFPRKVDYLSKEEIFVIKQDVPLFEGER